MLPIQDTYEYAPGGANAHRKRMLCDVGTCTTNELMIASVEHDQLMVFGRAVRAFAFSHNVDLHNVRYIDEMIGILGEQLRTVPELPLTVVANDGGGKELQIGFRSALPKGSRASNPETDFSFSPLNGIYQKGKTPRGVRVSGQFPPRQRFRPNPGVDPSLINLNRLLPVVVAGPIQIR